MSFKKTPKLGQHFLADGKVVSQILQTANLKSDDVVLEIGPGKGVLTSPLLDKVKHLYAVEKDGDLHFKLKKKYGERENISLYNQDIREFDLRSLPKGYKIVANIPYYLTGQLIQSLTVTPNPPSEAVMMIQKEVANRLTAPQGQGSILQMTTTVFAEATKAFDVSRDKFSPPPEVDSAVIKLAFRDKPLISSELQRPFFAMIKHAFAGKRKKISNTLASLTKLNKDQIYEVLKSLDLSENTRPQELSLENWLALFQKLQDK